MGIIDTLSTELADRTAQAAPFAVGIDSGQRPVSGILWRPDVVVTSEQTLPEDTAELSVVRGGIRVAATLAGRDPGTNVAVLKLESPLNGALPAGETEPPRVGSLALLIGADASGAVESCFVSFSASTFKRRGGSLSVPLLDDCSICLTGFILSSTSGRTWTEAYLHSYSAIFGFIPKPAGRKMKFNFVRRIRRIRFGCMFWRKSNWLR